MFKIAATVSSLLVSLGLASFYPPPPPDRDGPPPPKARKGKGRDEAKKKGEPGPQGDLRRAYDLLRHLRAADSSANRPEEGIRDWTDRAVKYYRDGLKALAAGDDFLAHENGAIAHDLARAADHAKNAAQFDRRDPDLPPPPEGDGPNDSGERVRRDLNRAYDLITENRDGDPPPKADFAVKASRDLYSAARRDVEAGREERGGELARAAEAMTHVADHLGHLAEGPPEGRDRREPRRPEPKPRKGERGGPERRDSDLPPPLPRD